VKLGPPILRKEHILRVFENTVPRKIFGPKRKWQEVEEEDRRRRLIESRRMKWACHVARM
jgi:hypothetical protein